MLVISRAKWLVFLWRQHQFKSGSANYFKLMQSCWPGEGRWAMGRPETAQTDTASKMASWAGNVAQWLECLCSVHEWSPRFHLQHCISRAYWHMLEWRLEEKVFKVSLRPLGRVG